MTEADYYRERDLRDAAANALLDQVEAAEEEQASLLRGWRGWLPWRLWRVLRLTRSSDRLLQRYDELADD